jgi:hypothetical protein
MQDEQGLPSDWQIPINQDKLTLVTGGYSGRSLPAAGFHFADVIRVA